ncbi:hypothetical protein GALMADRAFT_217588 [Galerina marginata CBS 339.88]|uniref:F-box domain-containing protein n=1 Tax=Galerina marginata (strain CBS 339.88) TaxID=685588 RepID=A0A067S3C7_GALM3|nr:hypothetical protein GALMADRAFT_217588 [Galerina marginata CBS 339.88]
MGLTPSRPHEEQQFMLPDDFLVGACRNLDIRTLTNIAGVNHRLRVIIKIIILARAYGPMAKIIDYKNIPTFMAMLTSTRSVVGGSIAQAVITPSILALHPATNLNVFVPAGSLTEWEIYLDNIGFIYSSESRGIDANSRRSMTFYFHNRGKGSKDAVVVCEAKGSSCLTPILAAQYTCNINFFTADHIYCVFPHFTPQLKTLHVNRKPLDIQETAELNVILERGVSILTEVQEKALCNGNILCRSMVRVTGTKPLRLTSLWAGDKIGILSWGREKEEFLHSKRVQFWLGGACACFNCINNPYQNEEEEEEEEE